MLNQSLPSAKLSFPFVHRFCSDNETYSVIALYFAAVNGDGNAIRMILQNMKSRFTYANTRLLLDFSVPDNTPTQSNDEIYLVCEFLATQRGASIIQDHNGWHFTGLRKTGRSKW